MAGGGKGAVAIAIGGNTLVTIAKFTAFLVTGSGSMLSEAIHSFADVLNQVLLMIGIVRASKKADSNSHYGYGKEKYVWALISAVGIFFLGCGVTMYHGIHSLMSAETHKVEDLTWAIGVLVGSLAVEGAVLVAAYRALKKDAGDKPFFPYLRDEADPSAVAVLLEDSAACLGVIIALTSMALIHFTGQMYWDAIGSIVIGLLLGAVAIWLVYRNHQLLVGRSAPDDAEAKVRAIIEGSDAVESIAKFRSRIVDLDTYDFEAQIEFDGKAIARRLEPKLKEAWPIENYEDFVTFAENYADDVVEAVGDEVDVLEKRIAEAVPEAKYLDLETN